MSVYLLVFLAQSVSAVYFFVTSGEERCFSREVSQDQVVLASYRYFDNPKEVLCSIIFKDKNKVTTLVREVEQDDLKKAGGQAAYMNRVTGEVSVCIQCKSSTWSQGTKLKWELRIDNGMDFLGDEIDSAKKEQVDSIQNSVNRILSRVHGLVAENEYERRSELQFKEASEKSTYWIVLMNIIVIVGMTVGALYQTSSLRDFFRREKLI